MINHRKNGMLLKYIQRCVTVTERYDRDNAKSEFRSTLFSIPNLPTRLIFILKLRLLSPSCEYHNRCDIMLVSRSQTKTKIFKNDSRFYFYCNIMYCWKNVYLPGHPGRPKPDRNLRTIPFHGCEELVVG